MSQWMGFVLAAIAACGLYGFDKHCKVKFGHAFLSKVSISIAVAATLLIAVGQWCLGHVLNIAGWGFISAGAAVLCYLTYRNIRGTNLWYGLGGSLAQIPVLLIASEVLLALFVLGVIVSVFGIGLAGSSSARERQKQEDDDWFMSTANKDGFWKGKGKD